MEPITMLKNLVVMAVADGHISDEELELLTERSAVWGLSSDDLVITVENAMNQKVDLELPASAEEGRTLLQDLIRMMAADGNLADVEKQLFAVAAAKMNIASDELNQLIDAVIDESE